MTATLYRVVKASERLPEEGREVFINIYIVKSAPPIKSLSIYDNEQAAFMTGGHRYPATLYYIEWLEPLPNPPADEWVEERAKELFKGEKCPDEFRPKDINGNDLLKGKEYISVMMPISTAKERAIQLATEASAIKQGEIEGLKKENEELKSRLKEWQDSIDSQKEYIKDLRAKLEEKETLEKLAWDAANSNSEYIDGLKSQLSAKEEEVRRLTGMITGLLMYAEKNGDIVNGFRTRDIVNEMQQLLTP